MLKHEMKATIGDTIRAYDFKPMAGREDCYVEGKVVDITNQHGYLAYEILVSVDKFGESYEDFEFEGNRVGQKVLAPFETSFMEFDSRIMNLSE